MKDNKLIRKVLFISKTNIALVVFQKFEKETNVLFATQVNLNSADLKVKINELLTNAANFLGFNIKEVEIVFDDADIKKVSYENVSFHDCDNKKEITKGIYKISKLQNLYVNEINFGDIIYDDIEKRAIVNYEVVGSTYTLYKTLVKAVLDCNVTVLNSTNIYTLINNKNASSEIIIKMVNGETTVCEYALSKLTNVQKFDMQIEEIHQNLAAKFNVTKNDVKQMIKVCNSLDANSETETLVSLNYDMVHKVFSGIKANEFIQAYQEEVNYQVNSKFNLNDYSEVNVITNDAVNKLCNAKVYKPEEVIGFEGIDADKLLALSRIDINTNKDSHFKFENSISLKVHTLAA